MLIALRDTFFSGWLGGNAGSAAVVANARCGGGVVDDRFVVGVVNIRYVNVIYRRVVAEYAVVPIAAAIADPDVAKTIVDAAVETDARPPIPSPPNVRVVGPAPIPWRPQCTGER